MRLFLQNLRAVLGVSVPVVPGVSSACPPGSWWVLLEPPQRGFTALGFAPFGCLPSPLGPLLRFWLKLEIYSCLLP